MTEEKYFELPGASREVELKHMLLGSALRFVVFHILSHLGFCMGSDGIMISDISTL